MPVNSSHRNWRRGPDKNLAPRTRNHRARHPAEAAHEERHDQRERHRDERERVPQFNHLGESEGFSSFAPVVFDDDAALDDGSVHVSGLEGKTMGMYLRAVLMM